MNGFDAIAEMRSGRPDYESIVREAKKRRLAELLGLARAKNGASLGSYQNPELMALGNAEQIANAMPSGQKTDPSVWGYGGRSYPTQAGTSIDARTPIHDRLSALTGAGGKYQDGNIFAGSRTKVAVRPDGRIALIGADRGPEAQQAQIAAGLQVGAGAKARLLAARQSRAKENIGRMLGSKNPLVRDRAQILADRLGLNPQGGEASDLAAMASKLKQFAQQGMSAAGQKAMLDAFMDQQKTKSDVVMREKELADTRARAETLASIERERLAQQGQQSRDTLTQSQRQFEDKMALDRQAAAADQKFKEYQMSPAGGRQRAMERNVDPDTYAAYQEMGNAPAAGAASAGVSISSPEERAAAVERLIASSPKSREQLLRNASALGLTPGDLADYRKGLSPTKTDTMFEWEDKPEGLIGGLYGAAYRAIAGDAARKKSFQRSRQRALLDALLGQ